MNRALLISLSLLLFACGSTASVTQSEEPIKRGGGCCRSENRTTERLAPAPPVKPVASPGTTGETASSATSTNYCCPDGLEANLGKTVTVKGLLQRTRLAPSIATESFMVYCLRADMPEGADGKPAVATGRLGRTDQYAARVTKDGGRIAGTGGGDLVLFDCKLQVIESE